MISIVLSLSKCALSITGVFQLPGTATEMMIAWTEVTSHRVTASPRVERVSVICLRAITATVFPEFISAMATTIVWITLTRMNVISAVSSLDCLLIHAHVDLIVKRSRCSHLNYRNVR